MMSLAEDSPRRSWQSSEHPSMQRVVQYSALHHKLWVSTFRELIGSPFGSDWPIFLPMIGLLFVSLLFRWTNLDLAISALFYDPELREWPWFFSPWCTLFYRRGVYLPIGLTVMAGLLIVAGGMKRHRNDLVRSGLFLLLVFAIGPGVIINSGFKPYWGRPRPHQVQEFGGTETFTPIGTPGNLQSNNSSFPSGHAAVAFYMISPAFIVSGRRPRLARALFGLGFLFGVCMSLTRVIQGGHFASDVIWSAGVIYLTGALFARWLLRPRVDEVAVEEQARQSSQLNRAA